MKSTYSIMLFTAALAGLGGEESHASSANVDENIVGNQSAVSFDSVNRSGFIADSNLGSQLLNAVNIARSKEQNCGGRIMPPAPALTWNHDLAAAAFRHSSDMANNSFFSHIGSDGSIPAQRVKETGYRFQLTSENIIAGTRYNTADEAMKGWLESPSHCKYLMDPNMTETGAALVENADTSYQYYWTQMFGKPQ